MCVCGWPQLLGLTYGVDWVEERVCSLQREDLEGGYGGGAWLSGDATSEPGHRPGTDVVLCTNCMFPQNTQNLIINIHVYTTAQSRVNPLSVSIRIAIHLLKWIEPDWRRLHSRRIQIKVVVQTWL